MEDLRLEISELKQQQSTDGINIQYFTSDMTQQKTRAFAMEIKLCELEKERKKNNDKIVETEKDIEDIQADVSAINEKDETDDANVLQGTGRPAGVGGQLDAIHENQEKQMKNHAEIRRKISKYIRCDMANGLMQGLN
ncbi:hypothetical protein FMUND_15300 [Fusarium mundagurra]|uniref:Uncharacterized protein n=1 Tax=Fusarium mundagurra TaxID=1567541 RepID=A0A8H5XPZ7_9HYPO|nr:hypothetical protein FMUND_15300 [Fusarium mundagurra]